MSCLLWYSTVLNVHVSIMKECFSQVQLSIKVPGTLTQMSIYAYLINIRKHVIVEDILQ